MSTSAKEIEAKVLSWVNEAIELRHGDAGDEDGPLRALTIDDGAQAVGYELQRVRLRSDRVDFLRTQVALLKTKLKKRREEAKFLAENKTFESYDKRNKAKADFTTGLALKSEASLDAFEERRAAHDADVMFEVVNDSYYIIDQLSRQLESIRADYRTVLRTLQFESTLDH